MSDAKTTAPAIGFTRSAWQFLRSIWRIFRDNSGAQHAGAIAYFGLLSLIPFSLLLVAVTANVMAKLGMEATLEAAGNSLSQQVGTQVLFLSEGLGKQLQSIAQAGAGLGVVSTVVLLFSASSVFTALNRGVNAILGTTRRQRFIVMRLVSALVLVTVATSLFAWQLLRTWVEHIADESIVVAWLSSGPVRWGVETGLFALGFFAVVYLMTAKTYRRRFVWVGAGAFVIAGQLARYGLEIYFYKIWKMRELYGGLAAGMGLVLWVYVAATVLLLSCALVRATSERFPLPPRNPE